MHHPDICNIMLIIEDYFLLVDDKDSRCEIQSVVNAIDEDNYTLGIRINRKLLNGYISVDICGEGEDDDTVIFNYFKDMISPDSRSKSIEIQIEGSDYCSETVRKTIRNILVMDKASIKSQCVPIAV
jgi:hypothetical protein